MIVEQDADQWNYGFVFPWHSVFTAHSEKQCLLSTVSVFCAQPNNKFWRFVFPLIPTSCLYFKVALYKRCLCKSTVNTWTSYSPPPPGFPPALTSYCYKDVEISLDKYNNLKTIVTFIVNENVVLYHIIWHYMSIWSVMIQPSQTWLHMLSKLPSWFGSTSGPTQTPGL